MSNYLVISPDVTTIRVLQTQLEPLGTVMWSRTTSGLEELVDATDLVVLDTTAVAAPESSSTGRLRRLLRGLPVVAVFERQPSVDSVRAVFIAGAVDMVPRCGIVVAVQRWTNCCSLRAGGQDGRSIKP